MIKINAAELTIMNDLAGSEPIKIDMVYAQGDHPQNMFKCAIYRPDAPFVLHQRLAKVVVAASRALHKASGGWTLVLKDGLRTTNAQNAIFETDIVKAHPEWIDDPQTRMFAMPGFGGHPRGMAVDVDAVDANGKAVDFGTVFDAMPGPNGVNPAHRQYRDFGAPERTARVLENRALLEGAFVAGAVAAGEEIAPLPHEWWDYRFPAVIYNEFAALSDADLPPEMQLLQI